MKKVKILKSICGAYNMGYFGGEEIEVSEALAEDMVQNGYAEFVSVEIETLAEDMVQNGYAEFVSVEIETKELKSTPEKAVNKR
jgi:hypothetical protein